MTSERRRLMRKLTVLLAAAMCLPLAACSDKASSPHTYAAPAVRTADGSEYTLPVSRLYEFSYDDIGAANIEAVCKAA